MNRIKNTAKKRNNKNTDFSKKKSEFNKFWLYRELKNIISQPKEIKSRVDETERSLDSHPDTKIGKNPGAQNKNDEIAHFTSSICNTIFRNMWITKLHQ